MRIKRQEPIHKAIREKFNILRIEDSVPHAAGRRYNRKHLAQLLGELQYNKGAEIGVRKGAFSKYLCQCNPNLEILCIDPWGQYRGNPQSRQDRYFKYAVKNLNECNAKIIRKTSMDALTDIEDGSLDFVYIDGNHQFDYVCLDIIFWAKKVKSGGIIGCHDYCEFGWGGVVKAVNGYTHCHHIDPWYITKELEPTAFWVNP
jgi:predicted O-methyltransferase YrrM